MKILRSTLSFLLFFSVSISFSLFAQENVDETVELGAIHIVYENFKTVDRAFVLSHIRLSEGSLYNRILSEQSLRSLYDTNYFEFVDFRVAEINGIYELSIHLTAKYNIKQIEFFGNQKFSAEYLLEAGEMLDVFILDEYQINTAAEKMSDSYFEKGYKDTNVNYSINRNSLTGEATVDFIINESVKTEIKIISFKGVTAFNQKTLNRVMKTKKKNLFSWLSGSGKFDQVVFEDDLEQLRLFYQNAGFLDVDVNPDLVSYDFTNPNKSRITIMIDEGEQYFLGTVKIEGHRFIQNKNSLK